MNHFKQKRLVPTKILELVQNVEIYILSFDIYDAMPYVICYQLAPH